MLWRQRQRRRAANRQHLPRRLRRMRGGNGAQYRQHELLLVRLQQEEKHQCPRFADHHDRYHGGLLQGQRHLDGGADCLGRFRAPIRRRARRHGRRRLQGAIPHGNPHPGSGKRPHENKRQQGSRQRREGRQLPLGARQNRISRCVSWRLVLRCRVLHEGTRRHDRRRRDGHVRPL